jgi:DNA-binding CsgD family transcriptional regulator
VPEFVNACQHVTQGNPFLLTELLRECLSGSAEEASLVRGCAPMSVARSVLLRLNRAGPDATAIARAVAILGDGVDLRQAARLAGLDPSASLAAADALSARRILCDGRPLAFSYPLVRNAVYQRMSAGERALGHARAACVLVAADEPVERVAEHLLRSEPGDDEWVAETLQFAAQHAMRDWACEAAIGHLERALREETSRSTRFSLLLDLGIVRSHIDGPAALEALNRAGRAAVDPDQIAAAAEELARVLTLTGRPDEALAVLRAAAADVETREPELARRLRRRIPLAAQLVPGSRSPLVDGVHEPGAEEDPLFLQYLAVEALLQGAAAQRAAELARKSLAAASPGAEESISLSSTAAIDVLCLSGHPHDAQREIDRACRMALERHSSTAIVTSAAFAARVALARGRLSEAERQARLGLGHARAGSWGLVLPLLTAALHDVLVERGEMVDALAIAEDANERAIRAADAPLYSNVLLVSLGRLGVTCGDPRVGLADLLLAGERATASAVTNPAVLPWRSEAALAHLALGEHLAGRELAAEELARARTFGAPRAVGIALRTVALVAFAEDDQDGAISRLREATAMLEAAGAPVELARASVELGVVLRRCRRGAEAREPLRRGLDIAHRCGALAIASRARTELLATGGRPRRASLEGRDALTPRERLVAQLAAQGQSNRDIAARLFLSPKTVESHLSRVFRKLQVKSRDELPAALDAVPPPVEQAL